MAIRYLNPAASTTNTNWNQTDVSYLAQGETSNIWNSTANSAELIVTLGDFDNTGVASIDSIQVIIYGDYDARSGLWTARTKITNASGTSYYDQNLGIPAGRTPSTVVGTVRTTSDGSTAWTDSDLDGMKLEVLAPDCTTLGRMIQFYIKVIYTEATGYGNSVNGVAAANISKINGVATANISKVNGV
tara:strand:- start:100 stop:663 length:564 start_codon:yes stop_codon:yes gene_type:complete